MTSKIKGNPFFIHKRYFRLGSSNLISSVKARYNNIMLLHSPFIKELFKDRLLPTKIYEKPVLATCLDFTDKSAKTTFLKK
jgi:hypothetical protein